MSAIIKASARTINVRALPRSAGEARHAEIPVSPAEAALAAARDEISELRSSLSRAKIDAEAAVRDAREAGRREGVAIADKTAEQRLEAIERGVTGARRAWNDRLAELDSLAALLSRAALRKIFEPDADLADLTVRAITRQVAALSGETVVAIRVSAADFDDPAALRALCKSGTIKIIPDPALESGACRFDLLIGGREAGPRAQWAVLEQFLDKLVDEVAK